MLFICLRVFFCALVGDAAGRGRVARGFTVGPTGENVVLPRGLRNSWTTCGLLPRVGASSFLLLLLSLFFLHDVKIAEQKKSAQEEGDDEKKREDRRTTEGFWHRVSEHDRVTLPLLAALLSFSRGC